MTDYNATTTLLLPYHDTLGNLRKRLLLRMGYSQQIANPPAGIVAQYNDYLQSAQRLLRLRRGSPFKTTLWFTWAFVVGQRFYDLPTGNVSVNAYVGADALPGAVTPTLNDLTTQLNPQNVEWVGISNGDNAWRPLTNGIDPSQYHAGDSLPWAYEFRNGIEVFPPPSDAAWSLRVKGSFDLLPFTADADVTSIDSELVFLHALMHIQASKGKTALAQATAGELVQYMGDLNASAHGTARYHPGSVVPPPAIPPKMV